MGEWESSTSLLHKQVPNRHDPNSAMKLRMTETANIRPSDLACDITKLQASGQKIPIINELLE